MFDLIVPVDFTNPTDVSIVVVTFTSFIKRKLNIRLGLVPLTKSIHSLEQARVVYHLIDTYGLQAAIAYLENSLTSEKLSAPSKSNFEKAVRNFSSKGFARFGKQYQVRE